MPVSLDDKYALTQGRAYLSGIDALVRRRLQRWRDQTAGFVAGYRGSPLGGLDRAMDPMKHANNSGTSHHGGVLTVVGSAAGSKPGGSLRDASGARHDHGQAAGGRLKTSTNQVGTLRVPWEWR